jgi:hypothetical protein
MQVRRRRQPDPHLLVLQILALKGKIAFLRVGALVLGGRGPRPSPGIALVVSTCGVGCRRRGMPPSPKIIAKTLKFAAMAAAAAPAAATSRGGGINRQYYHKGRGEGCGRHAQAPLQ